MADGWDLHAVVRGCTASSSSSTAAVVPINNNINNLQDPLPGFASLTFNNDDAPFYYPGFAEDSSFQFQGLEEIYRSFNSQPPPINSNSSAVPVLGGLMNQQTHLPPPPPPPLQQQQLIQPQLRNSFAGSSLALPTFHSQTARSRRRKNQQTKLVRQMTHEELLADSWAWRKYGQKPIKGSPNPRNYYRCSTSKGCAARKQVEKSPSDPNMYVVSYTGDHTHPRPTHRNSLAGSTRNKFATRLQKPSSGESSEAPSAAVPNPSCSSSSPVSASSFSPTTPLMEGESAPHENTQSEAMEIKNDDYAEMEEDTENDEEDLLIPNTVMSEDILKGFAELRGGFISGSNGLDSSWAVGGKFSTRFQTDSPAPWTPSSSTSAATTTTSSSADGGGC